MKKKKFHQTDAEARKSSSKKKISIFFKIFLSIIKSKVEDDLNICLYSTEVFLVFRFYDDECL